MDMMSYDCSTSTLWFTEVLESSMWASCRPKLQLHHRVVAGDSSKKMKGCRKTEQSSNIRGKTRGHFLHKIWPDFTKIVVLCDVWMCIVKFRFSKPRFMVKVTQCCFNTPLKTASLKGELSILSTFMCPPCFYTVNSTWMAVNGGWKCSLRSTKANTRSNFSNICGK